MTTEENKALVRRYFEAVDQGEADLIDAMFAADCIFHRGDYADPLMGAAAVKAVIVRVHELYRGFTSTIHDLIGEGDLVACRLQHNAVLRGEFTSRIGTFDVAGKPIEWSANVFFRFENGLIKEEWIARDELGILLGLGIVPEIDTNKL
jgi:predicted ester cyclase